MSLSHKGQVLPIINQMIPIDKETTFHANYDYGLEGFNQGEIITPNGFERCYQFNGSNAYIDLGFGAGLNPSTTPLTITLWVKASSISTNEMVLSSGQVGNSNARLYIGKNGSKWGLGVSTSGWSGTITPTTEWTFISVTLSGSVASMYINSQLTQTINYTSYQLNRNIYIANHDSNYWFSGMVSDVRIWNKVLSTDEISNVMNGKLSVATQNLLGHYRLDEGVGLVAPDSSSIGNDGKCNGNITSTYGRTIASLKKEEGKFKGAACIEENVAGTNLIKGSSAFIQNTSYGMKNYYFDKSDLVVGEVYTLSIKFKQGSDRTYLSLYSSGGYAQLTTFKEQDKNSEGVAIKQFTMAYYTGREYDYFTIYQMPSSSTSASSIEWVKIEKGSQVSNWSPHPTEDPVYIARGESLKYPIDILNHQEGTLSFWGKLPYALPFTSPSDKGLYVSTAGIYSGDKSLCFQSYNSTYSDRVIGVHWGNTSGANNHVALTLSQVPNYHNGDWNMYTITWNTNTGYDLYINGILVGSGKTNLPLRPFMSDYIEFKGMMLDELRIESRAISADEAAAWAASGLHYNYLDYSMVVD